MAGSRHTMCTSFFSFFFFFFSYIPQGNEKNQQSILKCLTCIYNLFDNFLNRNFWHVILYAYSGMLEFPGQVLELSMPVGRGTKGPPVVSGMDGFIDYLDSKALLRLGLF